LACSGSDISFCSTLRFFGFWGLGRVRTKFFFCIIAKTNVALKFCLENHIIPRHYAGLERGLSTGSPIIVLSIPEHASL